MKLVPADTKYMLLKASVISLFLHLSLLVFFVFTFSVRSPAKKPPMFFLGSFLGKSDFLKVGSRPNHKSIDIKISNSDLYRPNISQESTIDSPSAKPPFSDIAINSVKKSLKIKWAETTAMDLREPAATDLGIDSDVPKRLPLKLDP